MNNDFDRAVNFLQGALDVAMFEASKKADPQPEAPAESSDETQLELPLGEPPVVNLSDETGPVTMETETIPAQEPVPAEITGSVPAEEPTQAKQQLTVSQLTLRLALCACAVLTTVIAYKFLNPRVITVTVPAEQDGIPLALLPESADAELWNIVSAMHGTINGTELIFDHGLADAKDGTYKLALDFCRSGNDIYAKVIGNGLWVVKLAPDGTILKAYPTRPTAKPLKEIFAR